MILHITFKGLVYAGYNNLESGSITSFNDLCTKLVEWFNTSIPIMKSSIELFRVTQVGDESTQAHLKRFNEELRSKNWLSL